MKNRSINVYSEIGQLRTVLLHKPGKEIENLTPIYLERLLFDDIPYLEVAKKEHEKFAEILRLNNVEVLYLENLISSAINNSDVKESFLNEILSESEIKDNLIKREVKSYLSSMLPKQMIDKIMAGVRKKDILVKESSSEYPFILDPMPNLYFTRDPFASIGKGVSLSSMKKKARKRETIFGKYIFKYHEEFKNSNINIYYHRNNKFSIEGGDILVLSEKLLLIGLSERTNEKAISLLAQNIFNSDDTFETILIFNIPKLRSYMHLDTVFTMVDHDKFVIHPSIEKTLEVFKLTFDKEKNQICISESNGNIESILSEALNLDVTLIRCGGNDFIISEREQWNDGSNTLTISPGKVITYDRNYITNEILDKYNIEVFTIPSSELARGRGGPRCMSMPFYRDNI